jgi:putative two-component system response regulator
MTLNRASVLVVDDTPENIDILVETLKHGYQLRAATNGERALEIVQRTPPDLILLDIMMPGIDGFEVCRRLKADITTRHIPVIFITAKIGIEDELRGLELGAVDYITKPISPPVVQARVRTHLALFDQARELDHKVRLQTQEIDRTRVQIIQRLGRAAEYKDNETGLHVIRMSHYTRILAMAAGASETNAQTLMLAAPMHDIGKIGIPDSILRKPGKLTVEEFDIMKTHCDIGARIIGEDDSELLRLAKSVALSHHERWDGTGYPKGLKAGQIPHEGRIVAIADVFDALTTERPYKAAWPVERAVQHLQDGAGAHFDPELVPLFIENLPQVLEVRAQYAEVSSTETSSTP